MSSIFVRPTSTRKHNTQRRQLLASAKKINRKPWIIAGSVLGVVMILLGIGDWLLIRNERYRMQAIEVSHSGQVVYAQLADQDIVDALKDKHYYLTKYSSTLRRLVASHPRVSSLVLTPTSQVWIYQLIITYDPPEMRLRFENQWYGLLSGQLYPLTPWLTGLMLQIPTYFTGMTLSGLFYEVPAWQLAKQYQTIIKWLADADIQAVRYYVAARQIQVNTLTQEIYFDVGGNIFEQLKKYRSLSGSEQVPFQRIVDLGAIEDGVFVYP